MNDCPHGQQARTCEICELEAERDRLLAKLAHARVSTAVMANSAADAAAEAVGAMAEKLLTVLAERDRLRAVAVAAQEFDAAWTAWQGKIERGENVSSTDDESRRRAASIAALLGAVRQLDGSAEATDE